MSELACSRLPHAIRGWILNNDAGSLADTYLRLLQDRGYTRSTINNYVGGVAHLTCDTFVSRRLERWYREGVDIEQNLLAVANARVKSAGDLPCLEQVRALLLELSYPQHAVIGSSLLRSGKRHRLPLPPDPRLRRSILPRIVIPQPPFAASPRGRRVQRAQSPHR